MLDIEKVDHVGIRVTDKAVSIAFYERLGFRTLAECGVPLSGQFSYKDLRAVFIRDPDRNVIELDGYEGEEPEARSGSDEGPGYGAHP